MSDELKPCPFCGHHLEAWGVNYRHSLDAECLLAHVCVTPTDVEAWNRRIEARGSEAVAWLYEADGKRSVTLMDPEGSEAIAARAGFKITPLGPITNSSTGDAAGKDSVDAARYRFLRLTCFETTEEAFFQHVVCVAPKPEDAQRFAATADLLDASCDAGIASLTKAADGENDHE